MRVLVTGMIAGIDEAKYMSQVMDLAAKDGVSIRTFDLVEALESTGGKKLDMLLGTTDYLFEVLREREYRKIGFQLEREGAEHAIIRVPATITWNRINVKLKDHKEIAEYVNPDVIVTLIDAEWLIRQRFNNPEKQSAFLKRIKEQDHTIHDILGWMNEEVSLAEDWADYMNVPHFVLPTACHPDALYKLVRYQKVPSFYVSYSMTHSDQQAREEVDKVITRLVDYGVVVDPQAIEIGTEMDDPKEKEATYAYTVHRDLHWFVGKVDAVVAIHPYHERPPLSTGMMDELGHARDYLKRRYMIFPPKNLSPFTTDSYIEKGKVFSTPEEFFVCLEAEGIKPLA